MPLSDKEQQMKPNQCLADFFPKFQDHIDWSIGLKYEPIHEPYQKPVRGYALCGIERFAFDLCARNMTRPYSKVHCFKELEDIDECMFGKKREERFKKLKEASKKIGDRIPEMTGSVHWTY